MDLSHRSDDELLSDVTNLVGSHRELTAKLVAHLAEIEERRLHLRAGFPSMFEFCIRELRMGEGEAFRRILAARLGRRFPVVHSLLASGAVHLSALQILREHLTEENHAELFEAVSGKSKYEVEALLAARFPKPDVPSTIRKLPDEPASPVATEPSMGSTFELEASVGRYVPEHTRARVEPLSEARFRVEFTASAELREKLELCRDLLSHANPSRDLGVVVERAVDLLLAELERKRLGRTKQRRRESGAPRTNSHRVTNATRRKVYERDGLQCTYLSPEGRRCETRAFIELDHAEPRALGGGDDPENLRVRCRAHNQLWAEQVFGREYLENARRFRQEKCRRGRSDEKHGENEKRTTARASLSALEKVRLALTGMGFRDVEARRAIAEVARMHAETPTVDKALREALLVATAKCA